MKRAKEDAAATVDSYLAGVSPEARATLERIRETIRATAPDAVEVISYKLPCYKLNGMLVGFAAFKNHCSFFPMSTAVMKKFASELEPYTLSTGTIRFPTSKPLPKTLVTKIVKARMAENAEKQKLKKR